MERRARPMSHQSRDISRSQKGAQSLDSRGITEQPPRISDPERLPHTRALQWQRDEHEVFTNILNELTTTFSNGRETSGC